MNKKPINQPLYPNRPPIVPNAAPVVPGAPRDLGENARLKVLEDRLVPKNTKRIAKEIPDFDALLDSDYVYISNDDSELRKIRAVKLTSAVEGLNYNYVINATDKIEGLNPIGQSFTIPAKYFNRVPIYLEQVLLYLYIDDTTDDKFSGVWATTASVTDSRLKRDNPEPEVEIARLAKLNADAMAEYLTDLGEVEVKILAGIDILDQFGRDVKAALNKERQERIDADQAIIDRLDAEDFDIGQDGSYIKTVKQEDGQVSATIQEFDHVVDNTATHDNTPSTKAVWDAIDALDFAELGQDGKYIKTVKQENGQISATLQDFETDVINNQTDDTNAPTTKAVTDYVEKTIDDLDVASQGGAGKYIRAIEQNDGLITATEQSFDTDFTNATDNNAPTTKLVKDTTDAITARIDAENFSIGETGSYIKTVSQTAGQVEATIQQFEQEIIYEGENTNINNDNVPTVKAVYDLVYKENLNNRVTEADILDLFTAEDNEIEGEVMTLSEADNISDNTLELNIGTNSQIVNNKLVLE